jgi:hypothetical protein
LVRIYAEFLEARLKAPKYFRVAMGLVDTSTPDEEDEAWKMVA